MTGVADRVPRRATGCAPRRTRVRRAFAWLVLLAILAGGDAGAQLRLRVVSRPTGVGVGDNFGASVAWGHDLNGDGFDDFVVGAPGVNRRYTDVGAVYAFVGGPGLDSLPEVSAYGPYAYGHLGLTVAGIGDVSSDGYGDYLVGSPDYDSGVTPRFQGKAWLYFGGATLGDQFGLVFEPPNNAYHLGKALAGLGDVNGDGEPDFMILATPSPPDSTSALVYFGGSVLDPYADAILGLGVLGSIAVSCAGAGDVNGDGWNDIVVGSTAGATTLSNRVLIYYGGPQFDTTPDVLITDPILQDQLGFAVAGGGDVNGDGYADIVASAPGRAVGGQGGVGQVYVYFGGPSPHTTPDLILSGEHGGDNFGYSVAIAGDLDGDGYADIVVGAPKSDANGLDSGRIYVFFGGPHPSAIAAATFDGEAPGDNLGISVSPAGDPDLGGSDAFLAGATLNDGGAANAGRAYLLRVERYHFLAPRAGDGWFAGENAEVHWTGSEPADLELSLDGVHWDLVAANVGGAEDNRFTFTVPDASTGRARLRLTRSGMPPGAGASQFAPGPLRITRRAVESPAIASDPAPPRPGQLRLGGAVALGVDWDGDGRPDVIAGAPTEGNGKIYIQHEPADADTFLAVVSGPDPLEQFGAAVADVGDLDGDGWDDLAVGAPANDAGGINAGRVYVYRGGPASDGVPDWILTGARVRDQFGSSVARAGDLNGDGHADLVVGAPGNSSGGRAYVYFGGPSFDTIPDAVFEAGVPGSFGTVVAGAGDVNGDGFDDLLVNGPPVTGGNGAETVHLLFGSPAMKTPRRIVLQGGAIGDRFGAAIAGGFDLDGDGFADFAVGAPYGGPGTGATGQVMLYYGGPIAVPRPTLILTGQTEGEDFGAALAGGADLDGDGHPDLAIGAPRAATGGPGSGRVDVLFGGGDGVLDASFAGTPGSGLGTALAMRGVNTDSLFAILAAGAPFESAGGAADRGAVHRFAWTRWTIEAPATPERWLVGSRHTVRWRGRTPAELWFEPVGPGAARRLAAAAGGADENAFDVEVDASFPDSGRLVLRSSAPGASGRNASAAAIGVTRIATLLGFDWKATDGGVTLSWRTDPGPGLDGIAGYRVRRIAAGETGPGTLIGSSPITATGLFVPAGRVGDTYVLIAVNGLGEESEIGRLTLPAPPAGVRVWPQPGGEDGIVRLSFAAPLGAGGLPARDLDVRVFDVRGRSVTTLFSGAPVARAGIVELSWDGHDASGMRAGPGVYFLRVRAPSAGYEVTRRVVMLDIPVR